MAGTTYPVTGSQYGRDRLSLRTISLNFIIPGPTEDGGDEPYDEIDSFKPTAPMGLVEVGRGAAKQESGCWLLTIHFEGITEDKAVGALLEYDNAGVDSPIETFEKFALLATKFKARLDPETKQFVGWEPKLTLNGQQVPNPLYGDTHFLEGNAILRVTFLLKEFRPDLLKNLCKIDVPQVPEGTAQSIDTPEGKSWLKKSVKARFRGNVWEIEVEYWLGKWAPDIYAATS